jgi:hypothetical protein
MKADNVGMVSVRNLLVKSEFPTLEEIIARTFFVLHKTLDRIVDWVVWRGGCIKSFVDLAICASAKDLEKQETTTINSLAREVGEGIRSRSARHSRRVLR